MLFGNRYDLTLILGSDATSPLWGWRAWQVLQPEITALAAALGHAPSLRVNQTLRERDQFAHPPSRSWDLDDAAAWCHGSPLTEHRAAQWEFVDVQVFAPAKAECARRNPDAFIHIRPVGAFRDSQTSYTQQLLLAVRSTVARRHAGAVNAFRRAAYSASGGVLELTCTRRVWSLNEFESIVREDFSYRGCHRDALPDLSKPRRRWSVAPSAA